MTVKGVSTSQFVNEHWDKSIVPALMDYIRIPNQSPMFDKEWATNGYQDQAVDLLVDWIKKQNVKGLKVEVVTAEKRTPLIFIEVDPTGPNCTETVLLYGHLDKQPPTPEKWDPKFGGPFDPRLINGRVYGRGSVDDGYATFCAISTIAALQQQGIPHPRCVVTIEAAEESHVLDLAYYFDVLKDRLRSPTLVVCLDSACYNYDQWWITSSLRGVCAGTLSVEIMSEGVHSGMGSGIVPSTFRILRQLLSRIEDEKTGEILVKDLYGPIPPQRIEQCKEVAEAIGDISSRFPFVGQAGPVKAANTAELLLNGTWRPALGIIGIEGLPSLGSAGNVLRPKTAAQLSVRLPPNVDPSRAAQALKKVLEKDPPYGAKVVFSITNEGAGWDAPKLEPWLETATAQASMEYFNKPLRSIAVGGSIPFMGLLAEKLPKAQFLVTGLVGPDSNVHGPNEYCDVEMGKKVTCCVANVVAAHYKHFAH